MNNNNQFNHNSLLEKLMKYLYTINEQMHKALYVWILIDIVQFLTIITSLIGYVIKQHYNLQSQDLFDNFLSIFFNYSKIYDWLVISGACSALIVITALVIYIIIEFSKEIKQSTKKKFLNYCALTGTISIGLFQFFSQVMANNLINIVAKIISKELSMEFILIGFFLLNVVMMVFVSIFNSDRRIFQFCLVVVSLGLNMLKFTLTCSLLIILSIYYQYYDRVIYKKLCYFLIIITCIWCCLEANDFNQYNIASRQIYLAISAVSLVLFYLHYNHNFLEASKLEQNCYLVQLYKKRLKKEDKKEDYQLADQYFTRYFNKQREAKQFIQNDINTLCSLVSSVLQWGQTDLKQMILMKIKAETFEDIDSASIQKQVQYFQLLLQLKINMVELLKEVFHFNSQKKHEGIKVNYQINKLIHQIEKQFFNSKDSDENTLKIQEILYLQQLYKNFYYHFVSLINLLDAIFDSIDSKSGEITENTEDKFTEFTVEKKILLRNLQQINKRTGAKLEFKLYEMLSKIWEIQEKSNELQILMESSDKFMKLSEEKSKQKYNFSYILVSSKVVKYASIKFLSTYSYKESYIVGQSLGLIFPHKFNEYVLDLLDKNVDRKVFHSQIPIINESGLFTIVDATFYLIPEFKGQITYLIQFKKIDEYESKNMFLLNTQTLCIECFNKKIVQKFRFSIDKIKSIIDSSAIQFNSLFVFSKEERDFLTLIQKSSLFVNKTNRKNVDNNTYQKIAIKEVQKTFSVKALIKMDYLSNFKKNSIKNVILENLISFDVNNINYKVIKIEDAMLIKQNSSAFFDKTDQINSIKKQNHSQKNKFQNSTKDLKKKFQKQEYFCPIPNPYLPKILEKLNQINSNNRINSIVLIKIVFVISLCIFLSGMIYFQSSMSKFDSEIKKFEAQAQSLNHQYSYFLLGIMNSYYIHHIEQYRDDFVQYIQSWRNLPLLEAEKFYSQEVAYLKSQKVRIIQIFQNYYFQFPFLHDTDPIPVQIVTDFFTLNSTSKTTLIYDIVNLLIDSEREEIKRVIAKNFRLYQTMITILRPDGRYNSKIKAIYNEPVIVLLATGSAVFLTVLIIYCLLFRLREVRYDIVAIYRYIEKSEIQNRKKKINELQELVKILSSTNKNYLKSDESMDRQNQKSFQSQYSQTKSEEGDSKNQGQNQNESLLSQKSHKQMVNESQQSKKQRHSCSKITIFVEAILKYPIYLIVFILSCGLLFYFFYVTSQFIQNYINAFEYLEKVRAANFQFRYLYAMSQSYAYSSSILGYSDNEDSIKNFSIKNTHFSYEKPDNFAFQINETLCSKSAIEAIKNSWFLNYNCQQVDQKSLTNGYSQAFQKYQHNLRIIKDKSYKQMITDQQIREKYFNSMYEFLVFESYFNSMSQDNFQNNINLVGSEVNKILLQIFIGAVAWVILSFFLVFFLAFSKLETELLKIITMIKMVPAQTLFSIKVAALFKKRKILEKLNRL